MTEHTEKSWIVVTIYLYIPCLYACLSHLQSRQQPEMLILRLVATALLMKEWWCPSLSTFLKLICFNRAELGRDVWNIYKVKWSLYKWMLIHKGLRMMNCMDSYLYTKKSYTHNSQANHILPHPQEFRISFPAIWRNYVSIKICLHKISTKSEKWIRMLFHDFVREATTLKEEKMK